LRALKLELGDKVDVLYNNVVLVIPKGVGFDCDFLKRELDILARIANGGVQD
jgi:hypothetical protein